MSEFLHVGKPPGLAAEIHPGGCPYREKINPGQRGKNARRRSGQLRGAPEGISFLPGRQDYFVVDELLRFEPQVSRIVICLWINVPSFRRD
jgi:hypothetical protein